MHTAAPDYLVHDPHWACGVGILKQGRTGAGKGREQLYRRENRPKQAHDLVLVADLEQAHELVAQGEVVSRPVRRTSTLQRNQMLRKHVCGSSVEPLRPHCVSGHHNTRCAAPGELRRELHRELHGHDPSPFGRATKWVDSRPTLLLGTPCALLGSLALRNRQRSPYTGVDRVLQSNC